MLTHILNEGLDSVSTASAKYDIPTEGQIKTPWKVEAFVRMWEWLSFLDTYIQMNTSTPHGDTTM